MRIFWSLILITWASFGFAQTSNQGPKSAVLLMALDQLVSQSQRGQDLNQAYLDEISKLEEENNRLGAALEEEERELLELRPSLSPEDFKERARIFDEKVTLIRNTQLQKNTEMVRRREDERNNILRDALPIINAIRIEKGAKVVLERRSNIWSIDQIQDLDQIDITQEVIKRLDAQGKTPPVSND